MVSSVLDRSDQNGPWRNSSNGSEQNPADTTGKLGAGPRFLDRVFRRLPASWVAGPTGVDSCLSDCKSRPSGKTAHQPCYRFGRQVDSPPQLGQVASIEPAHFGRKVHSRQKRRPATCAVTALDSPHTPFSCPVPSAASSRCRGVENAARDRSSLGARNWVAANCTPQICEVPPKIKGLLSCEDSA